MKEYTYTQYYISGLSKKPVSNSNPSVVDKEEGGNWFIVILVVVAILAIAALFHFTRNKDSENISTIQGDYYMN